MNKTKWYARGVYWLVGLALVASLCLMLAGPGFAATVTGYRSCPKTRPFQ